MVVGVVELLAGYFQHRASWIIVFDICNADLALTLWRNDVNIGASPDAG